MGNSSVGGPFLGSMALTAPDSAELQTRSHNGKKCGNGAS